MLRHYLIYYGIADCHAPRRAMRPRVAYRFQLTYDRERGRDGRGGAVLEQIRGTNPNKTMPQAEENKCEQGMGGGGRGGAGAG